MDKNMIHIDELVRSRLMGGEEKERAGGWMAMQALLDKELPQTVAAAYNWRRLSGILALLLIGASVTVGGYRMAMHYNSESSSPSLIASASSGFAQKSIRESIQEAAAVAGVNSDNVTTALPLPAKNVINKSHHSNRHFHLINPAASANSVEVISTENPSSDDDVVVAQPQSAAENTGYASNKLISTPSNTGSVHIASTHDQPFIRHNRTAAEHQISENKLYSEQHAANLTAASQLVTPDGLHLLISRDSIQRIEVVQRSIRVPESTVRQYHIDTVSIDKLAVYYPILPIVAQNLSVDPAVTHISANRHGNRKAMATTSSSEHLAPAKTANSSVASSMTFQAPTPAVPSPAAATSADNNLVSLSSFKVSSVMHNFWNSNGFSDMVAKIKYKIKNIEVYTGAEAGINASLSGVSSLGGFQCGLAALFIINEYLSLNSGVYYYDRLNTGSTVHDNYNYVDKNSVHSYPTFINGVSYNHYSWIEDTIDHHFNYNTVQTIELPVQLRYSVSRFFGEAGLNLIYAFKTNATEITNKPDLGALNQANYATTYINPADGSNIPTFGTRPVVDVNDFNSRFGLGVAIGAGYHFSPAVTLNLHITKTFLDNARTDGSRKISTDIYKIPSMQLSVGYRFSQQKASRKEGE